MPKEEFYSFNQGSKLTKKKKLPQSVLRFLKKLEEEMYSEFNNTDWILYFKKKYRESNNREYTLVGDVAWRNERSIYNSVMKKFAPRDIKLMIDFLFDSDQDIMPKVQVGAFMLSSKWIDGVYRDATLWRDGLYVSKAQYRAQQNITPKRNREWIPSTEEDTTIMPKRKKKSVISI
jgi:cation transport regulator ChaB